MSVMYLYVAACNLLFRLHYLPPKGQPEDFTDKTYQSQLPLHARSTAAQVYEQVGTTLLSWATYNDKSVVFRIAVYQEQHCLY